MTNTRTKFGGKWARTLALSLVAGGVTLTPKEAQALLPASLAAVVAFYKEAYDLLSLAKPLFEESGPDLAAALASAKASIIAEIKSVRNQQWRANAQTVMDGFQILGIRKKNHGDNKRLWTATWDQSRQTINEFAEIVNARDTSSAYEMAPAFNALIATHTHLTRMMGELYPGDPATWGEYDIYLKQGIRANYAMIGMQKGLCWPGYNPGPGNWGSAGGTYVRNTFKTSMFYEDKLANRNVLVDRITVTYPARGTSNTVTYNAYCNPGKHSCTPIGGLFPKADSLATAESIIKPTFMNDLTVQAVQEGMRGIMALSGGDDWYDNSRTDLPEQGQYTEAYVYHPTCWLYPYSP